MKILAIEKEMDSRYSRELLKEEALHVWDLYLKEIIRELYFTEENNAVLIFDCRDKKEAEGILNKLPLVREKFITFDIMQLKPYTGFSRLFMKE